MSVVDVSIIIVHTFEKRLVRQTLRGIRRAAPQLNYEIVIVDNNPDAGLYNVLREQFFDVKYVPMSRNMGFGAGMNAGIRASKGRYVLIFNPDIVVAPGSLEAMTSFMDANPDVGVCGPKLKNPDGTLQHSCFRQPTVLLPIYRRTPVGMLNFAKKVVDEYLMVNENHQETMDVDALIGAALFARREVLEEIGLFDERFFMYYEDTDLCRRFWEFGKRVVYYPKAEMVHYHRRASADGGLLRQLLSRFAWIHIHSALKYHKKYYGVSDPRLNEGG
jgi:GT2 family glycosyltransferase